MSCSHRLTKKLSHNEGCVARPRSSARCGVLGHAHMPAYGRSLRPCIALDDRTRIDERHHVRASSRRTARAVRILLRDGGIPRWLRGLAALGLAPIPGPFDEAVLLVVAAVLWLGYRERLRDAWQKAS